MAAGYNRASWSCTHVGVSIQINPINACCFVTKQLELVYVAFTLCCHWCVLILNPDPPPQQGEKSRWIEVTQRLAHDYVNLTGDVLLAAG